MKNRVLVVLVPALLAGPFVAPARPQGPAPGTFSTTLAITRAQQLGAALGQMGGTTFAAGASYRFVPAFGAGLSLRYDVQDWPFDAPSEFGGLGPWSQLHRATAALNLGLALSRRFVLGLSPTVEWAGETHTPAGDGLAWGAVVSATGTLSPKCVLGAAANVSRQYFSTKVSFSAVVNWRWTDRLRLVNAPAFGPLGAAGIELRYEPSRAVEIAAGGVYRGDRFRLDRRQAYLGEVAEVSGFPMAARLAYKLPAGSRVDLHAGAVTAGTLTVKDMDGERLARARYPVTPMLAVSLSRRF